MQRCRAGVTWTAKRQHGGHSGRQPPVLSTPALLWRVKKTLVLATPISVRLSSVSFALAAETVNITSAGGSVLPGPSAAALARSPPAEDVLTRGISSSASTRRPAVCMLATVKSTFCHPGSLHCMPHLATSASFGIAYEITVANGEVWISRLTHPQRWTRAPGRRPPPQGSTSRVCFATSNTLSLITRVASRQNHPTHIPLLWRVQ